MDRVPVPRFNAKDKTHIEVASKAASCRECFSKDHSEKEAESRVIQLDDAVARMLAISSKDQAAIKKALDAL